MTADIQAIGADLVDIERRFGELLPQARACMEEQFRGGVTVAGTHWLDALGHMMAAQDHARLAGLFLGADMPSPSRTTTPRVVFAIDQADAPAMVEPAPPSLPRSRRPMSRRRPR